MIVEKMVLDAGESAATLTSYLVENSAEMEPDRVRPAVIICPGGGYEFTSDREAEPIALKMVSYGFQAFVLRYDVAPKVFPAALLQLAQSVKLVRENGAKWAVDVDKIIVAGFSAGGHLAASLGTFWSESWLATKVGATNEEIKPNGLLLAYPVITSGEFAHVGSIKSLLGARYEADKELQSLENFVSAQTPKTFLWHTVEDGAVPMENSLLFANALRKNDVPFELHIYPKGGHGLSLGTKETANAGGYGIEKDVTSWPDLFATWVSENFQ